ncbi:MAG: hypothetical protein Q9169_004851 [Polycauliona sp. 2 TL-2023]
MVRDNTVPRRACFGTTSTYVSALRKSRHHHSRGTFQDCSSASSDRTEISPYACFFLANGFVRIAMMEAVAHTHASPGGTLDPLVESYIGDGGQKEAMEDVAYPAITYGSLSSLYHELDLSTVLLLERAIVHRNLRNYVESLAIFDAFSTSTAVKAAVVLEHTWTLVAQYRFREAHCVAERGLAAFGSKIIDGKGHGPSTVLRALLAGLNALIDGSTQRCYESMQKIYGWLNNVPTVLLTDVQVWAVNLYYYLPTLLSRSSGSPCFRDIPSVPADSSSLGISLLRKHLQSVGRLNQALFLLDTEMTLVPKKDAEIEAMESVRSCCVEPSSQPVTYIEGCVALKLALLYAELGDDESYREEMFNAAAALSMPRDSKLSSNLLRTDTWLARLELARVGAKGPGAEAWEGFADYAAKIGDYRMEAKALTEALESMISPDSEEAEDVSPENWERLRKRLDELYSRLGSSFHRSVTRRRSSNQRDERLPQVWCE